MSDFVAGNSFYFQKPGTNPVNHLQFFLNFRKIMWDCRKKSSCYRFRRHFPPSTQNAGTTAIDHRVKYKLFYLIF